MDSIKKTFLRQSNVSEDPSLGPLAPMKIIMNFTLARADKHGKLAKTQIFYFQPFHNIIYLWEV